MVYSYISPETGIWNLETEFYVFDVSKDIHLLCGIQYYIIAPPLPVLPPFFLKKKKKKEKEIKKKKKEKKRKTRLSRGHDSDDMTIPTSVPVTGTGTPNDLDYLDGTKKKL